LSIVIPSYQRPTIAARSIHGWVSQVDAPPFEVLVVDDGSPTQLVRELERNLPNDSRVRLLRRPHSGLAATRNAGLEAARGSAILFVDDDMVPSSPTMLARWVARLRSSGEAWVPRVSVSDCYVKTAVQALWRERLERGGRRPDGQSLGRTGFWFGALMVERAALQGERFNEAFTGYGWEEIEFGARLYRLGLRARMATDVQLWHDDEVRFAELLRKYEEMGRNTWTFRRAAPGLSSALLTGTLPPVLWGRRLLRIEARGDRVAEVMRLWADAPPGPGFSLDLKPLFLALEGAYTRGIRIGSAESDGPGGSSCN
jgi:glycosyltransferase involved in cell wall biosynthesis